MPALQVRLGDDEYAKVKELAKLLGMSMSEYVRSRLFDGEQSAAVVQEPPPQMVPRPRPQRKPHPLLVPNDVPIPNAADVIGVIKAPAREVPLPPVKSRRKITAGDARAVQEFAEKAYPAAVEFETDVAVTIKFEDNLPGPDLAVMPFAQAKIVEFLETPVIPAAKVAAEFMKELEKDPDRQASPSGAKPLPVGELPIVTSRSPIAPPDFDDLEDQPMLRAPDGPYGPLLESLDAPILSKCEFEKPLEEVADIVAHVEKRPKRPGFKRSPKCTSSKCERLQLACCGACIHANAVGVGKVETVAPAVIGWVGSDLKRHLFKRHPKCVTEKCERMGPCCELCRQANAISF